MIVKIEKLSAEQFADLADFLKSNSNFVQAPGKTSFASGSACVRFATLTCAAQAEDGSTDVELHMVETLDFWDDLQTKADRCYTADKPYRVPLNHLLCLFERLNVYRY